MIFLKTLIVAGISPLKQIYVNMTLGWPLTLISVVLRSTRRDAIFELLSVLLSCFSAELLEKMSEVEKFIPAETILDF